MSVLTPAFNESVRLSAPPHRPTPNTRMYRPIARARVLWVFVSFHESVQLRAPGFEKWLKDNAPPPPADPSSAGSGGSGVERAQEAFLKWPLLHEVECEYVDTPEKVREGKGKGLGVDT